MDPDSRASFEQALASLDTGLFDHVPSQTSERDRLSLLALHNACRERYDSFAYLEIGSHLGGSLQVLAVDPRCTSIVSIDSRPQSQPDVRGVFDYTGNSTERMLQRLRSVPDANLAKLQAIEATTDEVSPDALPARPALCLIDGEHTVEAALRDARFCREAVQDNGAVAFHDRRLVRPAIEAFLEELGEVPREAYALLGSVYVVELGPARLLPTVERVLAGHEKPKPFLADHPARRFP